MAAVEARMGVVHTAIMFHAITYHGGSFETCWYVRSCACKYDTRYALFHLYARSGVKV